MRFQVQCCRLVLKHILKMFPWTTCSTFKIRCIIIVIVVITSISSDIIIIIVIIVEGKPAAFWTFDTLSLKIFQLKQRFTDRQQVQSQPILLRGCLSQVWIKRSKMIPCEVANKKRQNFISLFRYSNKANLNFLKQKIENFLKISRMIKLWNTCSITTDSKWFNHHSFLTPFIWIKFKNRN